MALSFKQRIFPYLVVVTGIMLTLGPLALAFSCAGIFYTPVSEALGTSKGAFALYMTFLYITMTVSLPFFGKIMERCDLRIVLTAASLLVGMPMIAMSQFNALWQFYIAGAIMGLGSAPITYLAVATLINRWFEKRVGFFVGICMAFSGIGGVIFNPIGGVIIASGPDGWRLGYLVFGIIMLVMTLPFTLFGIRSYPSAIGIAPVGSPEWERAVRDEGTVNEREASKEMSALSQEHASEVASEQEKERGQKQQVSTSRWGVSSKESKRMPSFYALLIYAFCVTTMLMFYMYFPSYATSLADTFPKTAALAAVLASFCMAGQAIGKVLLGIIGDRNVLVGHCVTIVCGIAGVVILWQFPGVIPLFLAAGFLYGILYASETVQMPLMARTVFGTMEYSTIYSRVSAASSLSGIVFASTWGFIIDGAGYDLTFILALTIIVILFVSGLFGLKAKNRRFGKQADN